MTTKEPTLDQRITARGHALHDTPFRRVLRLLPRRDRSAIGVATRRLVDELTDVETR